MAFDNKDYNDNELLYLINEGDEFAFEKLSEKYTPLIKNRLNRFKIKARSYDDFFEECLIVLYKCCFTFREDKNSAFNNYYDASIQNTIKALLRKERKYFYDVSLVDLDVIDYLKLEEDEVKIEEKDIYTDLEMKIINYFQDGYTIKNIGKMLHMNAYKVSKVVKQFKNKEHISLLSYKEQIIYFKSMQGYKPREISELLNLNISIVYNALKRAREKIRNLE